MANEIPADFQSIFRSLVMALQPRHLEPNSMGVYWSVLGDLSMGQLRASAQDLASRVRFFPTTSEWFQAASEWEEPEDFAEYPDGVGLDLLDSEPLPDRYAEAKRRDNICKRLSEADGDALMARYGYVKVGRTWVQQRDR